jgi:hypothetical protein
MAYVVPQVLVFEEFNLVPAAITGPLRAHISGPNAYLLRQSVPAEAPLGALGLYNPDTAQSYPWPYLPPAALVDPDYTKVFIDGAKLLYFEDDVGSGVTIKPIAGTPNRIRASGTDGFKANGPLYPRMPLLYDRDVQLADQVTVHGNVSGTDYTLNTYVLGLAATQTLADVAAATADAANGPTQTASSTVTPATGNTSTLTLAADLTDYDPLADGVLDDTYTLSVIQPSGGADLSTARVKLLSASGLDNDPSAAVAATGMPFTVGHRGLALTFTGTVDLVAGEVWTVTVHGKYAQIDGQSGGTYTGTQDTTYIVTVTRGGLFTDANPPQVTASTTTGVDMGGPYPVTTTGTAIALGTRGVTFTVAATGAPVGLKKGDKFYIDVTAPANGVFSDLILGHSLPADLAGATDLDLKLYIGKNLQVGEDRIGYEPITNWQQSPTELTVSDGIIAYDPTWTDQGDPMPLPVLSGNLFVEYRAWQVTLANNVGTISDVGDLDTLIPGPLSPDNPLKWGVYYALQNCNGTEVKFTAVLDPSDVDSWIDVLALLTGRQDVYNLVALTHDQTVLNLYAAHCNDQSSAENGCWRAMFCSLQVNTTSAVSSAASSTDGNDILATCADDPNTSGTQYTLMQAASGNANWIAVGVQPGDIVRYLFSVSWGEPTYQEFVIAEVVAEDTLLLVAGPDAPISTASKVEIWHNNTKDQQAADLGRQAGAYASSRVKAVWPDIISSGGVAMDGYYLCCALAGLRSGVVPHQGMTNLQIAGFDDVSRTTTYFSSAQLNVMAGDGTWIVTQEPDGRVKTRHAVTTDNSDINHREEMVFANLDSMAFVYLFQLQPFIGVTNVTPSNIARLRVEIVSVTEWLKTNGYTETLGSQLIDGVIVELHQHAILLDRVVAVIDLTLPYPLNNIELHLVV